MSDRETTKELLERLRRHYIKPGENLPGGIFVPECGINGGLQARCDALYVGFTSTSGRILIGHEIKASRADWRKELDTAGKADTWADNCHAWYVVAPSTDVVPVEELPVGWGLMVPSTRTKTRMQLLVKAEVHRDRQPAWRVVRSIMARQDTLRARAIADRVYEIRENAEKDARERYEQRAAATLTVEQRDRLDALDRLEAALGVKVALWGLDAVRPEHLAAALRIVAGAAQLPSNRHTLSVVERYLDQTNKGLTEIADAITVWTALTNNPEGAHS